MTGVPNRFWIIALIGLLLWPTLAYAEEIDPLNYGIVNTSRLNVRSGDHYKFEGLGVFTGGTRLQIIGRNMDASWLFVSDGETDGWVHANFVIARGMSIHGYPIMVRAYAAALAPNHAVVNTSYLNLREGAGVKYRISRVLSGGTTAKLIGRNADWRWVYVELDDGETGWINSSFALLRGATVGLTVERLPDGNLYGVSHGVVNTSFLNMRSGDGIQYEVQEILKGGDLIYVLGRNEAGNWLYVLVGGDREGWVHSQYVALRGQGLHTYPLAAPASDAAMAPSVAVVNTPFLNVRAGASITAAVVAAVPGGTELIVLARDAGSNWLQVQLSDGELGWVNGGYVVLRGPQPGNQPLG